MTVRDPEASNLSSFRTVRIVVKTNDLSPCRQIHLEDLSAVSPRTDHRGHTTRHLAPEYPVTACWRETDGQRRPSSWVDQPVIAIRLICDCAFSFRQGHRLELRFETGIDLFFVELEPERNAPLEHSPRS